MINKLSNYILNKVLASTNKTEEEKEIILFGITRIIEDIPKTIGIILIGLALGVLNSIVIITTILISYKSFVGGLHLKTNFSCFIYSILFYLITIYAAKYIQILFNVNIIFLIYIILFLFAIYTIIKYAPADVIEMPKLDKSLRKTLKIKSFISLNIIYTFAIFIVKDIETKNLLIFSIFFINLMGTRVMYKLLKVEYGYETFMKEDVI